VGERRQRDLDARGDALQRRATRDADRIELEIDEGRVTLTGAVQSWNERQTVIGAVRGTRGVEVVVDSSTSRREPRARRARAAPAAGGRVVVAPSRDRLVAARGPSSRRPAEPWSAQGVRGGAAWSRAGAGGARAGRSGAGGRGGTTIAVRAIMMIPAVSHYMTKQPWTIERKAPLSEAHRLMRAHAIRHLPVVDGEHLIGIVSMGDLHLLETIAEFPLESVEVEEAMTANPCVVPGDTALDEVVEIMSAKKYGCVIIAGRAGVEGIFTTVDACRAFADTLRRGAAESLGVASVA
jgi:acetoin utilization protein AcuB